MNWYAARVSEGRKYVNEYLASQGIRCYSAAAVPSILFIRCSPEQRQAFSDEFKGWLFFYRNPDRTEAAVIPDDEMASFIIVTSNSADTVELNITDREFLQGERVRVTAGPFEGAEGVVKRIKGDRRLVVEVRGVAVVATSFIHPALLEKVAGK